MLGLPNEKIFPLGVNHRNLCRFPSQANQNYLLVEDALIEVIYGKQGHRGTVSGRSDDTNSSNDCGFQFPSGDSEESSDAASTSHQTEEAATDASSADDLTLPTRARTGHASSVCIPSYAKQTLRSRAVPSDTAVKVNIQGTIVKARSQRIPQLTTTRNETWTDSPVTHDRGSQTAAAQQNPEKIAVRFHGLVYKLTPTTYMRRTTSHTLYLSPTTLVASLNMNLANLLPGRPSLLHCE